jgi:glycosyltransferase involved in cell wall biosynthesis
VSRLPEVQAVGVVVPARDEEELLPHCLDALNVAVAQARRQGVHTDVLVVLDSCVDGSAAVAAARPWARSLEVAAGSVGRARAAGLAAVVARHWHVPRRRLWLATTDADSRVPPDWLVRQVALADRGADVVLGTVAVDDWSEHPPQVASRWRAGYSHRDGHGHVHGANVGLRADAYLEVGGFATLERDEDVALVAALAHRPVVRTGAIPVLTSARRGGRASGGFADHLAGLG